MYRMIWQLTNKNGLIHVTSETVFYIAVPARDHASIMNSNKNDFSKRDRGMMLPISRGLLEGESKLQHAPIIIVATHDLYTYWQTRR